VISLFVGVVGGLILVDWVVGRLLCCEEVFRAVMALEFVLGLFSYFCSVFGAGVFRMQMLIQIGYVFWCSCYDELFSFRFHKLLC
jgi:hypothetical protein